MAARTQRFTVGDLTGVVIADGTEDLGVSAGLDFVNATPDETEAAFRDWRVANPGLPNELSYNIVALATDSGWLLVDTGNGVGSPDGGWLLEGLAAAEIAPVDIATVVITHAHTDHINGNTTASGAPTFPNARYVIGADEWARCSAPLAPDADDRTIARQAAVERQFGSLGERIETVATDAEIAPAVRAVSAPGHTSGQIGLLITSGESRLLHLADAVHLPLQLARPDWYLPFDSDGPQAAVTRRALFQRAAAEGWLVCAYHFPFPGLGYIESDGAAWRWRPAE